MPPRHASHAGRYAAPVQDRPHPIVRGFADMWPTLSVEVRRDAAGALLTSVRGRQDKTVEILPRWGEPVVITCTSAGPQKIVHEGND